uniref:RNA-directed RNA polymerase n=1 Tax=Rhizoctonia solani toti-like virus 1 TaxID=3095224 RepID=A0AAU6NDN4_9VIRU
MGREVERTEDFETATEGSGQSMESGFGSRGAAPRFWGNWRSVDTGGGTTLVQQLQGGRNQEAGIVQDGSVPAPRYSISSTGKEQVRPSDSQGRPVIEPRRRPASGTRDGKDDRSSLRGSGRESRAAGASLVGESGELQERESADINQFPSGLRGRSTRAARLHVGTVPGAWDVRNGGPSRYAGERIGGPSDRCLPGELQQGSSGKGRQGSRNDGRGNARDGDADPLLLRRGAEEERTRCTGCSRGTGCTYPQLQYHSTRETSNACCSMDRRDGGKSDLRHIGFPRARRSWAEGYIAAGELNRTGRCFAGACGECDCPSGNGTADYHDTDDWDGEKDKHAWLHTLIHGGGPAWLTAHYGGVWPRRRGYYVRGPDGWRSWVSSLSTQLRALYRLEFHISIAGTEDFYKWWIGCGIYPRELTDREWPVVPWHERPVEVWTGGSPIRIHLDMVRELGEFSPCEWNLIRISRSEEWCCATTIFFLRALPERVRQAVHNNGFYAVPLNEWIGVFKGQIDWVYRSCMLAGVRGNDIQMVRSIFSTATRDRGEADWFDDVRQRRSWCVPKYALCSDAPVADYLKRARSSLASTAREHVRAGFAGREMETMQEWWSSRHHTAPSGSSSLRAWAREELAGDQRLRGQDRPGKKAVVEVLDETWLWRTLCKRPETIARTSTKNEPGDKLRPLHANNDSSYTVEAYASVQLEKSMSFRGMYGKQLPADVMDWVVRHDSTLKRGGYWSSLDYSNFNTEHSKFELMLCNLERGRAWEEASIPRISAEKALCSYWMGVGHDMAYLVFLGGTSERVYNGLYSGSRNTLTDHNYMHRAYVDSVEADLGIMLGPVESQRVEDWMVGDDEDRLDKHWTTTAYYSRCVPASGHQVQVKKLMAGGKDECPYRHAADVECGHTFLQRNLRGRNLPTRPLARLLATLGSGNWYVEPGVWFTSAVQSNQDNWWEAVSRGAPIDMCRKMCAMILDRLMVVLPEKDKEVGEKGQKAKRLEWWSYRGDHPLWRGMPGKQAEVPQIDTKPDPIKTWPSRATDAWMAKVDSILKHLREGRSEQYRKYLLRESCGASFHHHRQRALRDAAREHWPERVESPRDYDIPMQANIMSWDLVVELGTCVHQARRPVDEEEQAARMGLDAYLVKLCGAAYDLRAALSDKAWSRYASIVPRLPITVAAELLDSGLRAWFAALPYWIPRIHRPLPELQKSRHLWLVWAGNCAGKSFICSIYKKFLDMDVAAYRYVGWQKRQRRYDDGSTHYTREADAAVYTALAQDYNAIMTQWPLELMVRAAKTRGIRYTLAQWDVPEDVRRKRMAERGWDADRIELFCGYNRETKEANNKLRTITVTHWQELVRLVGYN